MHKIMTMVVILFFSSCISAENLDIQAALSAKNSGDYKTAISIFEKFAEKGDSKAMTTIGVMYFDSTHEIHDYNLAYDWFLKAAKAGDWDGVNNIGVMFRDGLGVDENKYIAYDLFMLVHLIGDGQSTISRANNNIRKLQAELPESEITEALKLPIRYVKEYMKSKGILSEELKQLKHKKGEKNFIDLYKRVYN